MNNVLVTFTPSLWSGVGQCLWATGEAPSGVTVSLLLACDTECMTVDV